MKEEIEITKSLIARRTAVLKSLENAEKLGAVMSLKDGAAMIGLKLQIRQDRQYLKAIKLT